MKKYNILHAIIPIQSGFTVTELITVIVIIGIMSAAVVPRFFDRGTFDSLGFYDQTISTLRYAQKTAISQRRLVCVTFPGANSIVLRTTAAFSDAACNIDLQNPSGGASPYTVVAPAGVVLGGAVAFNFNPLGSTTTVVAPITVGNYTITIVQETGYVR